MSDRDYPVEVAGTIATETPKAVLFDDGTTKTWLPKSQIEIEPAGNGLVEITLPYWLAYEQGLI